MRVSVVIPAFDAADTIGDTLASLLSQTFRDWEAVVVDDGSRDATAAIVQRQAKRDGRIRLVQQTNAGEAGARNSGVAAARHDWLLFLDADDWIAPQYLERMTAVLQLDPALDAVHCGYARVACDGSLIVDKYMPPAGDMFPVWARRSAFPVHACVVRKSIVELAGGFDISLRKSADWDLWQRIARTGARFGAVREILAFYRMRPGAASLEGALMLEDGLRVLRQGHSPDPRVKHPHPDHARGAPPEQIPSQEFYLLAWCAGVLLGSGHDARGLLTQLEGERFSELYPPAIAQCLFDAIPLPRCLPASAWDRLWPELHGAIDHFLVALEEHSGTPGLARNSRSALARLVLALSPAWAPVLQELDERMTAIDDLNVRVADLEGERRNLRESLERSTSDRNAIFHSAERQLGHLLLNRMRLARPLAALHAHATAIGHRLGVARLTVERWLSGSKQTRVAATVCWNFPIHSQTFVYQELKQLARKGMALRLIYSKLDPHDQLPRPYEFLWQAKRRLFLNRPVHRNDYSHYYRRMPEKIDALITRLSAASGMSEQDVKEHGNFLEAFSFTRMLEAYRPHYLHSYFFYDRSLMALVAGYLLEIPRGISCYADHVLKDYELKVVGLHLELCDVVIATSERIRRELMELAPGPDHSRILVKPNGIDTDAFDVMPRVEPEPGTPFRIVTVCRIEPKKGLLDLIEAVYLLRQRGLQVEAHLVGAPDEWSAASMEYKRQVDLKITGLDLWGSVHLEGRQGYDGVRRLLGVSHLFVAPFVETEAGDKDGIPTALLEGMATGLPSVATDAGSIPEVIENGREGLLVAQRNPAALADAIESLLLDPERRARFGQQGADTVRRRFDARTCETAFHERVDRLVHRSGRAGSAAPR